MVTNTSGVIEEENLPDNIRIMTDGMQEDVKVNRILPLQEVLEKAEAQLVRMAFEQYPSSYKVARALGISQSGASRKYQKYVKPQKE